MTASRDRITQALALLVLLMATACSTTSNLPDDEQLFVGLTKIAYPDYEQNSHSEEVREELEAALATAPNGAVFGSSYYRTPFQFRLWIWNATTGSHGVLKKWINRTIAKPPVLMSQVNPALRAQVARQVLRSNGYMRGDVTYKEVPEKPKARRNADGTVDSISRKAKIAYTVRMDSLMTVDTISYVGFPEAMVHLIDSTREEADIKPGTPFSVANLDAERTRLSQLFRNKGYYYYMPDYASYLADTLRKANRVELRLQMADSLPQEVLRPWYIGTRSLNLRRTAREQLDSTSTRRSLKVSFSGKHPPLRPGVILTNLKLRPRRLFSYDDMQESVQKVNGIGVFSSVDFKFTPRQISTLNSQLKSLNSPLGFAAWLVQEHSTLNSQSDTLDVVIDCVLDKPYDFYVETNLVNRTIGRLGPEMRVGVTRRNAFHGAEKLDVNLHGAYEWETGHGGSNMNSYQYGVDASIEFPRILFPRFRSREAAGSRPSGQPTADGRPRPRRKRYYSTPWTIAKVATDVVRRPNYYKMHIVSGEWTYRWQKTATSRHEFSPLTVKYQFMNSHTELFDSLLDENPYLSTSMSDYFIPKMRYTYTYSSPSSLRNPLRWEFTFEEAGNLTAAYDVLVQGRKWSEKDKTLFKNPYSQFQKIETDLTKTWTLNTKTKLVGHMNYGVMWSYGNSTSGPFSEKFYVGGANSIRAFPVRSIGPGAFPGDGSSSQFSYVMQNGDVKIVMNLELRQRLFGNLYGALFLDAGNVWSSEDWSLTMDDFDLEKDDKDYGIIKEFVDSWNSMFGDSKFKAKSLFKQMATGTGIGFRYDLDFLVLRLDWGFGLHLPYDTGKSGYFNILRFKDMHTLHIAIGYPF